MPLYEYACQECGKESELLVNSSTQPVCPKCGSSKIDKLLSIVATHSRGNSLAGGPQSTGGSCGAGCSVAAGFQKWVKNAHFVVSVLCWLPKIDTHFGHCVY